MKSKKNWLKELMPYFIILIVVILIRTFIITIVRVNGSSMYDTLDGGEIMLLNKLESFKRYDIVVAKAVIDNKSDIIIKRVYGMPGETIKCEEGRIYVNDKLIEDNYGYGKTNDFDTVTLKENEYFLLGDNRSVSLDSRYIGPIKKEQIEGTTNLVLWPINKFGKVE